MEKQTPEGALSLIDRIISLANHLLNLPAIARKQLRAFIEFALFEGENAESKKVKNLHDFVAASNKILKTMRKAGCTEEEIRDVIRELHLPAARAQLSAIIAARKVKAAYKRGPKEITLYKSSAIFMQVSLQPGPEEAVSDGSNVQLEEPPAPE